MEGVGTCKQNISGLGKVCLAFGRAVAVYVVKLEQYYVYAVK